MGKLPSLSNPNHPKSKHSKKRQLLQPLPVLEIDESPYGGVTHSAASDGASSISRRPNNGGFVTFSVSTYTKKDLMELKYMLVSELERLRELKNRFDPSDCRNSKKLGDHQAGKKKSRRPFPPTVPVDLIPEKGILLKNCGQILSKVMKHKLGYIFNSPVDVIGLKLHDYHDIIKIPMDLGSVKAKLGENLYSSPKEFAADVRLTFENAMRYNPKGHDVFMLAEQLLARFEELYKPIEEKERLIELEEELEVDEDRAREAEASSWDQAGLKPVLDGINPNWNQTQHEDMDSNEANVTNPIETPSSNRAPPLKAAKLPKPKAKDPNKRDMSLEEKHKLGMELQILPPEKMDQVVSIIRKRSEHLQQDGDEIELDIEAVDIETLWELDRFVTNYKKAASKLKRQGLMSRNVLNTATTSEINKLPVNEKIETSPEMKKPAKGVGEDDIDIGDEAPVSDFPSVEINKDNGHGSSSSSDGSTSSSDSGSSSGSDSEQNQIS